MKFKFTAATAASIIVMFLAHPAEARHHHYRHHHYRHHRHYQPVDSAPAYGAARIVSGRPSGCPHAYCGCGTSLHVFGRIIPQLNLAENWLRYFPRAYPAAGMVAARRGHVFAIESVNGDGTVVAYDSNSGHHLTRVHTVSLRGYAVVDPHAGTRLAFN